MSIPGILADEWKLNPFMRLDSEELKNSLGIDSDEKNFTKIMDLLRSTKNAFK